MAEKKLSWAGGWMGVGVVGLAENKANSAQLELELGLSLAKSSFEFTKHPYWDEKEFKHNATEQPYFENF